MTQVFDDDGQVIPVTVIQAGPCYVTQIRSEQKDGYTAVQLGFEELPPKRNGSSRLNRPKRGHLQRAARAAGMPHGVSLPDLRVLREFRVKEIDVEEGQKLVVSDVFAPGERVDIVGTSKGRGFAGTVKRHGFNRQSKTHGASDRERAPGSIVKAPVRRRSSAGPFPLQSSSTPSAPYRVTRTFTCPSACNRAGSLTTTALSPPPRSTCVRVEPGSTVVMKPAGTSRPAALNR